MQPRTIQTDKEIHWAVTKLGLPAIEVGLKLGLGQSADSRAAQRGQKIVMKVGINFEENGNAYFHGRASVSIYVF